jgi:hypothetical protein
MWYLVRYKENPRRSLASASSPLGRVSTFRGASTVQGSDVALQTGASTVEEIRVATKKRCCRIRNF